MKNTLLIAALTLTSASAFASLARLNSLQSAAHLTDIQDITTRPDQALNYGDAITLEFGTASSATAAGTASGGFIRKMNDSALAVYMNNRTTSASTFRTLTGDASLLGTENALNLDYATKMTNMQVGVGLYYSASSRKPDLVTSTKTQDATGIYLSAVAPNAWDAQLAVGLSNNAKYNDTATTEKTVAGKSSYKLSGGYWMDSTYLYAYYQNTGATFKSSTATLNDFSNTEMLVGAIESMKKDGTEFFYGAAYKSVVNKDDGTLQTSSISAKSETTTLPLIAGIESEANSWLTLRGSITQSVLLNTRKIASSTSTTTKTDGGGDTTVAAGTGIKFGKVMFDGTLSATNNSAVTNGTFGTDGANFIANTSFTYLF